MPDRERDFSLLSFLSLSFLVSALLCPMSSCAEEHMLNEKLFTGVFL